MLFYQIGELFQSYAVGKSRRNISELMDIRPDYANIEGENGLEKVDPDEVEIGSIIVEVHSRIHIISAKIIRSGIGQPVKSKICPKTPPVFTPWCMIMVAVVIPIPTIRPMERSVPASRIRPATPSARNILGDACCRMFSMLL